MITAPETPGDVFVGMADKLRSILHRVKTLLLVTAFFISPAGAQHPPVESPLLDHLVGAWVLQGTIAGKQTTHDIKGKWVANHQYLQLHEVSREKSTNGSPQYDAFIFVGWNERKRIYSIIFLDNFWGIDPASIGAGASKENEVLFTWEDSGAVDFTNDFVYDPKTDSWHWTMDNIVNGVHKPFGRVTLTRTSNNAP